MLCIFVWSDNHVCLYIYIYIYVCFKGEWLAPAFILAVLSRIMASSTSLCRLLAALHTPQGRSLLPWQWWAKIEEADLVGCGLCRPGLWGRCSPQQKGTQTHRRTFISEKQLSLIRAHTNTRTAVRSWMNIIPSPSFRQVLGLNHWKENYLSDMFKTSTFHPIMMAQRQWFPLSGFFKTRWPCPTGRAAGKHQMQQVKSILLPPTRPPHWPSWTAHEIVIGEWDKGLGKKLTNKGF